MGGLDGRWVAWTVGGWQDGLGGGWVVWIGGQEEQAASRGGCSPPKGLLDCGSFLAQVLDADASPCEGFHYRKAERERGGGRSLSTGPVDPCD